MEKKKSIKRESEGDAANVVHVKLKKIAGNATSASIEKLVIRFADFENAIF